VGKNDGSVQGIRYWTCPPNHGLFVRPSQVIPCTESQTSSQLNLHSELAIVEELNQQIKELTTENQIQRLKYEKQIQILEESVKNFEAIEREQQQNR
jgi:dynactin complex subunit